MHVVEPDLAGVEAIAQVGVGGVLEEAGAEGLQRLLDAVAEQGQGAHPWLTAVVRQRSSQQSAGCPPSGTSTRDWWHSR